MGIHLPPYIPERKRTLFQMLRLEQHFQKKLEKLQKAQQGLLQEEEQESTTVSKKRRLQQQRGLGAGAAAGIEPEVHRDF